MKTLFTPGASSPKTDRARAEHAHDVETMKRVGSAKSTSTGLDVPDVDILAFVHSSAGGWCRSRTCQGSREAFIHFLHRGRKSSSVILYAVQHPDHVLFACTSSHRHLVSRPPGINLPVLGNETERGAHLDHRHIDTHSTRPETPCGNVP